jgi:hypothetical protein
VILSEFSIDRLQDVQSLRLVLRVYGTRRNKANLPEPVCLVLTAQVAMLREAIEDARRRSGNKLGLGADWVATADKVLAATAPAEDVR